MQNITSFVVGRFINTRSLKNLCKILLLLLLVALSIQDLQE
jgi:hypothetical protein